MAGPLQFQSNVGQTGKIGGVQGPSEVGAPESAQIIAQLGNMGQMDTGALEIGRDQKHRDASIGIANALLLRRDDAVQSVIASLQKT